MQAHTLFLHTNTATATDLHTTYILQPQPTLYPTVLIKVER